MSTGKPATRDRSRSNASLSSRGGARQTPPPTAWTPENSEQELEPCAATGSYLLYAQRNTVLVLHHDTLSIERRFELHREDVRWIAVDTVSERGAGRLAVSYDSGNTAIVWDILTGGEVARFAAYDCINVAVFMRNGNIAFGNVQGSIILFEPSTSEHISARTIFDPITALAPANDCRTFSIGYLNGSILVATLQPAFTILHTLTTSRAPSRITGLAWHGSSSKQKTDMLATQTADGDLRVWSVPKAQYQDTPTIIRMLQRSPAQQPGPCWFAWSKNGRIIQHTEGETRSWDVRTKKVTYELIPTIDGIVGMTCYGPTATLFTLGHGHTVQQYDVTPGSTPMQVASVQHVPANTPPTPPTNLEELNNPYTHQRKSSTGHDPQVLPLFMDGESSTDEGGAMSPLQKIALEMDSLDQLESELRDKITPLSPSSSRASSVSSMSSRGARQPRKYLYDRASSRASSNSGYNGTEFSFGESTTPGHDNMSMRSKASSRASNSRYRSSGLRKEVLRSPQESKDSTILELFPFTKARLREVAFRTPYYGSAARTPELLQREMLSTVFGWNDDIGSLIREEISRQRRGSASGVLLSKWLGDSGADAMASMIGSQSMTSSDWMLLALSSIGLDSQKTVGEAFVQRLLEKGDVHPAVAILLGLGEQDDGIEVYVSQGYFMEALLLTCLTRPSDWGRQAQLLRKWGEIAVQKGEPELAVRIFSCASVETSEAWFSPRAQDAVYAAQQQRLTEPLSAVSMSSPPLSPPSRSGSQRLAAMNAPLKLVTSFGEKVGPITDFQNTTVGITPIAESALPMKDENYTGRWLRAGGDARDPSSARTATPGGYAKRRRLPSKNDIARAKAEAAEMATPLTAAREARAREPSLSGHSRRTSSSSIQEPVTALAQTTYSTNPLQSVGRVDLEVTSSAEDVIKRLKEHTRISRDSEPDKLVVDIVETRFGIDALSPGAQDNAAETLTSRSYQSGAGVFSPPLTGASSKSVKGKPSANHVSSLGEARVAARHERAESRRRNQSRNSSRSRRGTSRVRDTSEVRGNIHYIQPARRSPSSPVPMSPEEITQAGARDLQSDLAADEDFYRIASKIDTQDKDKSKAQPRSRRPSLAQSIDDEDERFMRSESRATGRGRSPERDLLHPDDDRGRDERRGHGSSGRSPSLPSLVRQDSHRDQYETQSEGHFRMRSQSAARRGEDLQTRRAAGRVRERSSNRQPRMADETAQAIDFHSTGGSLSKTPGSSVPSSVTPRPGARTLTRKQLAAKELEERRLSLARRPSAPVIPRPEQLSATRPTLTPRSYTELGNSPTSTMPPLSRSATVDPDAMTRHGKLQGYSTPSVPIGLPATPRAMRNPHHTGSDLDEDAPPVPDIPDNFSALSGSMLSQLTSSSLAQNSSSVSQHQDASELDSVGPLLPSTVFGLKGPQAPPRSMSAPPEKAFGGRPSHPAYKPAFPGSQRRFSAGRGHLRDIVPPEPDATVVINPGMVSIDEALHGDNSDHIVIVPEEPEYSPVLLPQLQHLANSMPPPPPPPPLTFAPVSDLSTMDSGMINVVMGTDSAVSGFNNDLSSAPSSLPQPMERASTTSPSLHYRHQARNSVSESLGSRMRGFGDRMRSSSRGAARRGPAVQNPMPYETVIPSLPAIPAHHRRESLTRAKSPYELAMAAAGTSGQHQSNLAIPPPPPPAPSQWPKEMNSRIFETAIPPGMRSQSAAGYRNPREVRANMPPDSLQAGSLGGFL